MQMVLPHELKEEEYFWLHYLRDNISSHRDIEMIAREYQPHKHSELHQAVMDVIVRGNIKEMEEAKNMCEALYELFADELKTREFIGRREGITSGKIQSIFELLEELGTVPEKIRRKIQEEKDEEILSKWHKSAAKASSMEEFRLNNFEI